METSLRFAYSEGFRSHNSTKKYTRPLKFEEQWQNIHITITFHPQRHLFCAYFSKSEGQYYPKDYSLISHYWEGLLYDIEGEMRTPELNAFFGPCIAKTVLAVIKSTATTFFSPLG